MFVTKKKHEAAIKHYRDLFEARGVVITDRDQTIGRLQRENARLLGQISEPQEQKDEGATYVLKSLAECLGLADWSIQSGSETWEGDVSATMYRILVDAGVIDDEDNAVATHDRIKALETAFNTEAAKLASVMRDKLAESERIRSLALELAEYKKAVECLRPDAEKHREKLRRDRRHAANKRAQKVAA